MDAPLGSLEELSSIEDRTLYAYRPKKRTTRGVVFLVLAFVLMAGGLVFARFLGDYASWIGLIFPLIVASGTAYCGMLDLLRRPLFHVEVDRRARTLALAISGERQELFKARFDEAVSVDLQRPDPRPVWTVKIRLRDGRNIGLGVLDDLAAAESLAARFSDTLGVPVQR